VSYCRWSSDDFQCDVYVYEGHCFITHVAGRKRIWKEPLPEKIPFDKKHLKEWMDRHKKVMQMCKDAELVDIGLSRDGMTFDSDTSKDCAELLISLKDEGYNVPQYAIDALMDESKNVED